VARRSSGILLAKRQSEAALSKGSVEIQSLCEISPNRVNKARLKIVRLRRSKEMWYQNDIIVNRRIARNLLRENQYKSMKTRKWA